MNYPEVPQQPSFPKIEEKILREWKEKGIFEKSLDQNGKVGEADEFVFYDGPPFANGLPHYGHLLTGYVKDVVPRYQTMRGKRVDRRFGWDCHGLPAELETEKQLGISGKIEILEYGMDKFNDACRSSVMKYTGEWEKFVTRQARWVDFENDYKTMDASYMESVIWAFKQLYDKGLVYEGYRVMPYSWAAETPLSNFETRLDNSYRERQDPALTVRFELLPTEGDGVSNGMPTDLLAWTTTPWTLPSNLALAVGPEIDYAIYEHKGRRIILGEATFAKVEKELEGAQKVGSIQGKELVGRRYHPLFPFFKDNTDSFRVLGADFIDTEEGTGIVHMAPGFGEEDMRVCQENGIPVVCPVDEKGCFTSEVPDWNGMLVLEANKPIIKRLKAEGKVVKHETYLHNYPHCWRTDEPLIYKALSSWYVEVSKFRDRMVELNQEIHWIPGHIRDGLFGKWLEGARDWSISRNRFWGTPIPIWRSDDPSYPRIDVYGSFAELEADFGVEVKDLHRPAIDELVRPNPDDPTGKSMMRRVPDVLDCWFESGSMPYAQVHYPFENRDWFEGHFPADFVVEYVAQTRGWFYTNMVLSTALFDKPGFSNCICHGVILDTQGKKLSKRMRNYPDPLEMFDKHGADAMRWFLMSSPILRGNDLQIDKDGKSIAEVVRLVQNPIWNAYYFFTLYANSDGVKAEFRSDSTDEPEGYIKKTLGKLVARQQRETECSDDLVHLLDRYILAKTASLVDTMTILMDAYDLPGACQEFSGFLDALNNWYIRRSRERFWREEQDQDKKDAYDTLYTVLVTLCRVGAPLLPLLLEEIHKGLTGAESVHLESWPEATALVQDPDLVKRMDRVREVCSAGLGLRRSADLRVRQPLASLKLAGKGMAELVDYFPLIQDEVNVKQVLLGEDLQDYASFVLKVNARALGPRLGPEMKKVIVASKKGDWKSLPDGGVEVGGQSLQEGEYELLLQAKEGVTCQALPGNDALVILDTELTEPLVQEGKARDLLRLIQQARKSAGLHVSDRIQVQVVLPEDWAEAIKAFAPLITENCLSQSLEIVPSLSPDLFHESATLGSDQFEIGLAKV